MVNLPHGIPGQVMSSDPGARRNSSSPRVTAAIPRNNSMSKQAASKDTGLTKRTPSLYPGGSQRQKPTMLLRRPPVRLPWLDGNATSRTIPGSFSNDAELVGKNPFVESTESVAAATPTISPTTAAADITLEELDLRYRSTGSPQTLSNVLPKPGVTEMGPLSTTNLPVSSPRVSPADVTNMRLQGSQYTPSNYSSTPPSEHGLVGSLPQRDPASYERLVQKRIDTSTFTARPETVSAVIPVASIPQRRSSLAFVQPSIPAHPSIPTQRSLPLRTSSLAVFQPASVPESVPRAKSASPLPTSVSPSSLGRYNDGTLSRESPSRQLSIKPRSRTASEVSPRTRSPLSPDDGHGNTSLQRAVTGLQGLMEEALQVAQDAARQNRTDEVAAVLDEATRALRKASTVHGRMSAPLRISDSQSEGSSGSYTSSMSDASSVIVTIESGRGSQETVPTVFTRSAQSVQQPIVSEAFAQDGKLPRSEEVQYDFHRPGDFYPSSLAATGGTPDMPRTITMLDSQAPVSPKPVFEASTARAQTLSPASTAENITIAKTPPRLYQQASADSIVIDFAYVPRPSAGKTTIAVEDGPASTAPASTVSLPAPIPVAASASAPVLPSTLPPALPPAVQPPAREQVNVTIRSAPSESVTVVGEVQEFRPGLTLVQSGTYERLSKEKRHHHHPRTRKALQSRYYEVPVKEDAQDVGRNSRHHMSLPENRSFRVHRYRRQPIAREWNVIRKRVTATIACINTALVGLIAGIYAGEVPKIQYQLSDVDHRVILGNVLLYIGLGIATLLAWPLPLLHGRKPYTLAALAIALPLQFPQAVMVSSYRSPAPKWFVGLLLPRALSGLALGFANVNFIATLFDLFGASLQSNHPHQELVDYEDIRRQGGGMGLWLGIWAWCFVGSLALGFLIGAGVTAHLNPEWGFYLVVLLLAVFLLMNVVAPETRRAPYRRSVLHYMDEHEKLKRRVARGEVKLHISQDGPKYWWEEVGAGVKLMWSMLFQPGFLILTLYLAWIYALVVLVTLLLGALLSRDYSWKSQYVGLAVFALAIGAALAIPLSKANLFSRDRKQPQRTDSMTFQSRVTWSSHLVRRCVFTFALPIAGLAFVLTSPGRSVSWAAPTIMSGLVGFLTCLAVAECVGLIMEAFDTCDLQPGVNSKHRLQSLESTTRRRRTNYSSFPRIAAGLFLAQGMGFFLAAASTGVSGRITRALGAQAATGVVAGILLGVTILLSIILWRYKSVQVIPDHAFGTRKGSKEWSAQDHDAYWKPVVIGQPSGKMRRMNMLEMGHWSRWTEIRKLNKLARQSTA